MQLVDLVLIFDDNTMFNVVWIVHEEWVCSTDLVCICCAINKAFQNMYFYHWLRKTCTQYNGTTLWFEYRFTSENTIIWQIFQSISILNTKEEIQNSTIKKRRTYSYHSFHTLFTEICNSEWYKLYGKCF